MKLQKIFLIIIAPFILSAICVKSQSLPSDLFSNPRFMAVNEETGRLYVLNSQSQDMAVLDVKSRILAKKIQLAASDVSDMVRNAETGKIYISHLGDGKISLIEEAEVDRANYAPVSIKAIEGLSNLFIDERKNQIYGFSAGQKIFFVIDGFSNSFSASWKIDFDIRQSIPFFKSEKIYFILNNGGIGVLNLKTGSIRQLIQSGNYFFGAPDEKYNRIYFLNEIDNRLSVLDVFSDTISDKISVGPGPKRIIVSPELDRLYVSNLADDSISVINIKNLSVVDTFFLDSGASPGKILVNHRSGKIYIPSVGFNKIVIADALSDKILKEVEAGGRNPGSGEINFSANEIYFLNPESNSLVIIDGATDSRVALLPAEAALGGPVFARPSNIFVDSFKNWIYVLNNLNGTLTVIDGNADKPIKVVKVGANPRGITASAKYNKIYVTNGDDNTITVLNRETLEFVKTFEVDDKPRAIAVNHRTGKIYIIGYNSGKLFIVDAKTDSLVEEIKLSLKIASRIQFSSERNRVYIPDLANSDKVFVIDAGKNEIIKEIPVNLSGDRSNFWVTLNSKLYAYSATEGKLVVMNEADYAPLNTFYFPINSLVDVSSRFGSVHVARDDGFIDVIDGSDGKIIKSILIGKNAEISSITRFSLAETIGGGERLMVLDRLNGKLFIYDFDRDENLAVVPVGRDAIKPFLDYQTGKIYIANSGDDLVSVFDAKKGKLLALITNDTPIAEELITARWKIPPFFYYLIISLGLAALLVIVISFFRRKGKEASAD